jgi:predicted glycoside hydrolase/deacetylase ChbG (UPF0249 family)
MTAVPTHPRGVILCADDFALNASVSRGIARLAEMGHISATSVMTLSHRWAQDVALLKDLRDRMDVGLHLDWTSDFALAAGHGLSLGAAMIKATLGEFDRNAARHVIERQLDAFESQWKAAPDFVDGHQHVQQFAGIREALVQVLASRYGHQNGRKPYLRISRTPVGAVDLKGRVIAALGANALESVAQKAGIAGAGGLLGIYDFKGDMTRYAWHMEVWLGLAPEGCIIMCHPALAAEPGDAIGIARAQEFAYLSSNEFAHSLERAGVMLVRGVRA